MQDEVFSDRLDRSGDDGRDFEHFVLEALSVADREVKPVRRLARGRDGAIDLVAEGPGATTVIECKYIGDLTFKTAQKRWRKVAGHLRDHLPRLAAHPMKAPRSPYRLWLDVARPVQHYVFCVSARMTILEQRNLEGEIQKVFRQLAETPGLAVLSQLGSQVQAVSVRSWDHFVGDLNACPALRYKWFGGLPTGARLLAPDRAVAKGFRGFLHEAALPFFSRTAFMQETGQTGLVAEEATVAQFDDDEAPDALIIAGPGGVGKTRLSLELGLQLVAKGWLVVCLDQGANEAAVQGVVRAHRQPARIAFILDYAEAARSLDRITYAVRQSVQDGGHRVHLMVTCRTSALHAVQDALVDLSPRVLHLSAGDGTAAYDAWVCQRILAHGALPDAEAIGRICGQLPALAAFVVFLFTRDRTRFDAQFAALHDTPDFQSWARRRVAALCGEGRQGHDDRQRLTDLALALPLAETGRNAIADQGGVTASLLDRLEADRWVEWDGGLLVPAHDVLTDSIAALWLFELPHAATTRVTDTLRRAAQQSRLPAGLIVVDRLVAHPGFATVDGEAVVRSLMASNAEAVLFAAHALLFGRLVSKGQRIRLLDAFESLRDRVADDRGLDGPLSAIAEHEARLPAADPLRQMAVALEPLLDAGFGVEPVQPAALQWIAQHGQTLDAQFVYRAWLDAGGGVEPVRAAALEWLAWHGQTPEAQFVYKAWLDAGGGVEPVRAAALQWIAQHGQTLDARFFYRAWLDAGGGVEPVRAAALEWLAWHGTLADADFVLQAWLDAGGGVEPVRAAALQWIAQHGQTLDARFFYRAWLDAGGGVEPVRAAALEWLAWHGTLADADFVLQAWLEAGGAVEPIRTQLFAWLAAWRDHERASFVSKSISQLDDLPDAVLVDLAHWSARHRDNPDAIFRMSRTSRYLAIDQTGAAAYASLLGSGWVVLLAMRRRGMPADGNIRFAVGTLLSWMARGQNHPNWGVRVTEVIASYVADGSVFYPGSAANDRFWGPVGHLLFGVMSALRAGMLDLQEDARGIGLFTGWLRSRPDPHGDNAVFLDMLVREFPDGPWGLR